MDSVIAELRSQYSKAIVNFEETLVELAIKVAEHILDREISTDSEIVLQQARKAIQSLDDDIIFKIRLHPDNIEVLQKVKSQLVADSSRIENVIITPDMSVDKGSCILETSAGTVDARLSTQLELIRRSLVDVAQAPPVMEENANEVKEETNADTDNNQTDDNITAIN
jgi:flagellar assembly protein FliH